MQQFADAGLAQQVFVAAVAVIGTARLTRLLTEDTFPPISKLRDRWIAFFNTSEWATLAICPFCMSMYVAAANLAVGMLSGFHPVWLVSNTWLSLAYLAAILTSYDGGDRE